MCRNPFATVATVGRKGGRNLFDPWTATEADLDAAYKAINPHNEFIPWNGSYQGDIVRQWRGAQLVKAVRSKVEAGDGALLMACMREIVVSGLVAPDWLARAFNARYEAVEQYQYMSWDEAFGKPHPPKTNQRAKRKALILPFLIWQEMGNRLARTNKSINDLLKEMAKEIGISETEANTHYYKRAVPRFGRPYSTLLGKKRRQNPRKSPKNPPESFE